MPELARAREGARPASDIDIMVLMRDLRNERDATIVVVLHRVEKVLLGDGQPVEFDGVGVQARRRR
jgi:predicted nucleotidyltransferase